MKCPQEDIVTDVLTRLESAVLACLAEKNQPAHLKHGIVALIRSLDEPIRRDWKRRQYHVASRSAVAFDEAKAAALDEIKRTGNVANATRHGVSRATLYRLLKQ